MGTKTLATGLTLLVVGGVAYAGGDTETARHVYETIGLYGHHAAEAAKIVVKSGLGATITGAYLTSYTALETMLRGTAQKIFGEETSVNKTAAALALATATAFAADTQTAHHVYHHFVANSEKLENIVEMASTTTGVASGISLTYSSMKDLAKKAFNSRFIPKMVGVAAVSGLAILAADTDTAHSIYQNLPLIKNVHPNNVGEAVQRTGSLTLIGSGVLTVASAIYYGAKRLFKKDK
ncbi:hypothetical protein HY643_00010 [Candidatus Woesearchaeota archaeon]|nr:hypothetical protein [Candidatus Woesearchaeota archaeon]